MQIRTELTFPKELKEEAIICCLCKEYDIVLNIVEASFSTDTGWAILVFKSNEEELKKVFEYIKDRGIKIESTEEIA